MRKRVPLKDRRALYAAIVRAADDLGLTRRSCRRSSPGWPRRRCRISRRGG